MKTPLKTHSRRLMLKKVLAFFVMIVLLSGILSPQKAFCRDEGEPTKNPLSQQLLETPSQNIPFLADKAVSFGLDRNSPTICKVKEYADKALYALQHHMAPLNPSRTIEEFNNWMAATAEIFFMEAYFMHKNLCGAVRDIAQEKEFLKISCGLYRDYLEDKKAADPVCWVLDGLEKKYPTMPQENPVEKKGK